MCNCNESSNLKVCSPLVATRAKLDDDINQVELYGLKVGSGYINAHLREINELSECL